NPAAVEALYKTSPTLLPSSGRSYPDSENLRIHSHSKYLRNFLCQRRDLWQAFGPPCFPKIVLTSVSAFAMVPPLNVGKEQSAPAGRHIPRVSGDSGAWSLGWGKGVVMRTNPRGLRSRWQNAGIRLALVL